jgi:hypothetical protein
MPTRPPPRYETGPGLGTRTWQARSAGDAPMDVKAFGSCQGKRAEPRVASRRCSMSGPGVLVAFVGSSPILDIDGCPSDCPSDRSCPRFTASAPRWRRPLKRPVERSSQAERSAPQATTPRSCGGGLGDADVARSASDERCLAGAAVARPADPSHEMKDVLSDQAVASVGAPGSSGTWAPRAR